ncbi:MAG: radical SAM protein [Halobacteriota archaeon]|nr:radical SAM protein [Halobacteriota archaeon]
MKYEGVVHRPPPEFGSLIIQATIGCPYNKCAFCGTFKDTKFRIRSVEEICEDIEKIKGPGTSSLFLADGNSIVMKTEDLVEVVNFANKALPNFESASLNASAKYILKKGEDELKMLREAGLDKIYMGLETGDEELLKEMSKGVTATEAIEAAKMVINAGMELSQTIIIGLGGTSGSLRHVHATAEVLNEIDPHQIRLHTLTLLPGTPLYEEKLEGGFEELTPEESIIEIAELINALDIKSEIISHRSNHLTFQGMLPEDKTQLLELIDFALSPEGRGRWASEQAQYNIARFLFEFRRMLGNGR